MIAAPIPAPGAGWATRRVGAAVGGGVATASLTIAAAFLVVSGGSAIVSTLAVPVLTAGVIGGWAMGPRSARAATLRGWLGTMVGLALLAVLIGDFVVVIGLLLGSVQASGQEPVTYLIGSVPAAFAIFLIGLVGIGPVALVFTLPAAAVWAWVMSRLRRRQPHADGSVTHSPSATPSVTNNG